MPSSLRPATCRHIREIPNSYPNDRLVGPRSFRDAGARKPTTLAEHRHLHLVRTERSV